MYTTYAAVSWRMCCCADVLSYSAFFSYRARTIIYCAEYFFRKCVIVQNISSENVLLCRNYIKVVGGEDPANSSLIYIGLVILCCMFPDLRAISMYFCQETHFDTLEACHISLTRFRYYGYCTYSGPSNSLLCVEGRVQHRQDSTQPPWYVSFDLFSCYFLGHLTNASQIKLLLTYTTL